MGRRSVSQPLDRPGAAQEARPRGLVVVTVASLPSGLRTGGHVLFKPDGCRVRRARAVRPGLWLGRFASHGMGHRSLSSGHQDAPVSLNY